MFIPQNYQYIHRDESICQHNDFLQAPAGSKVFFQVNSLSFPYESPCQDGYVEIKYGSDMTKGGAR